MNWYLDTRMNLHIDNHSNIVGRDIEFEEIKHSIASANVQMVQISAYGAIGTRVTYPSKALPFLNYPEDDLFDTVGLFERAARSIGIRFFIYINTRGFLLDKEHPDWVQRDAKGNGSNFKDGNDMCCRPTADSTGYLDVILLPLLQELTERYQPDGFWVDGDHARSETCYCGACIAAWHKEHPDPPPKDPAENTWADWYQLNARRRDEYRRKMAMAVHEIKPDTLYCSNHSYCNVYTRSRRNIDPRSPESWVGYLSEDLSHGDAVTQTRLAAMQHSPLSLPGHDIMHLVSERVSEERFLQQGALALSAGGPWFVWASNRFVDQPEIQRRVAVCSAFVEERQEAMGRSSSANPVAVVLSETEWNRARTAAEPFLYIRQSVVTALALQDCGVPVDIINEALVVDYGERYQALFAPAFYEMNPMVRKQLIRFAGGGLQVYAPEDHGDDLIPFGFQDLTYPDFSDGFCSSLEASSLTPYILSKGEGADRHLLFVFRRFNRQTVIHVIDISSHKDGKRILAGETDLIDDVDDSVTLSLTCRPVDKKDGSHWNGSITTVPRRIKTADNDRILDVERDGADGTITITRFDFSIHCALVFEGSVEFLPTGGKPINPYTHYPQDAIKPANGDRASHGHMDDFPIGG